MDNGKRNALDVLTTNDIREHARNWTLAGDVGLLALLEKFSESIINKTQETHKNFNELVDDYEELHTKVGNITNQFLALQNCQFVENRVYDEETPTEEKTEVKVEDEAEQEKLLLMQYKEVVEVGIKLLDTHFQEIQLPPNSDSDEEDEVSAGNSVIWKPKNPYAGKKFPFLIGSAEWWADDHVGLKPNEDILDTEKIVSESESDAESLKSIEKTTKLSSSSSMENIKPIPIKPAFLESTEDLFGFDKDENLKNNIADTLSKGSNSLCEEPTNFLPDFDREPEPESKKRDDSSAEYQTQEQVQEKPEAITKPKKVDNEFTRELMAKLVSVTSKGVEKKEEEEKAKEAPPPRKSKADGSLFDETDDSSDLFSTKITRVPERERKGERGLFFDAENDDDLFKGENDLFSGGGLFESEVFTKPNSQPVEKDTGSRSDAKKEEVAPKKNLVNNLFDDLDDDDTFFAVKPTVSHKPAEVKSLLAMENDKGKLATSSGLDWENDGLFDNINDEFGDDFFNSSGLFDAKTKKPEEKVEKKDKEPTSSLLLPKEPEVAKETGNDTKELPKKENSPPAATEKNSLEDPFGFSSAKDSGFKSISILDAEEEEEEEDNLFSKSFLEEKKPPVKVTALAEDDDDISLFADKPKPSDSVSVSSSRSSLFDDVSASKSRLASVFEKDKNNKVEADDSLFAGEEKHGRDLFSKNGKEGRTSLFDDCSDDDGEDLFGGGKKEPEKTEKGEKNQVHGAKSFIDDLDDTDFFKKAAIPSKLRNTKSEILKHSEKKLFVDDSEDSDLFATKPATTKPKPPNSLSLKTTETETKSQPVGKLNIPDNLKVKFESVAKHISPGARPSIEERKQEKKERKEEEEKEEDKDEKKKEILDEPIQQSTLLKCPSKDRVKIPGRRRPQSRRARQEAIRNSGTWDQALSPTRIFAASQPPKDSLPSPVASNPLSPSTDEEDFFKVPELDTYFEKEDQSIFKSDLFESSNASKLDDNLLFDGAPVLSPVSPSKKAEETANSPETDSLFGSVKPKTTSMFDDEDLNEDDENLFKTPKSTTDDSVLFQTSGETKKGENKLKKSLFDPDIDDDEDDLFGGKSLVTPKPPALGRRTKPKEGGEEPKGKRNSNFVDPLGLIARNE